MIKRKTDWKLKPVTGKYLAKIFGEKRFVKLFRRTVNYTHRTGHESGFVTYRDIENNLHYSNFMMGSTDRIHLGYPDESPNDIQLERRFGKHFDYLFEGIYDIFDLHFHPDSDMRPFPSFNDLNSLSSNRERLDQVSFKPISVIGVVDNGKRGELLLIQEDSSAPLEERLIDEVYPNIQKLNRGITTATTSTEEIVDCIRDTGLYKATNMRFKLTDTDLVIPDSDLERLDIFSYSPKINGDETSLERTMKKL